MQNIMDKNIKNKNQQPPKVPNIANQIIIALFIFISITLVYSFVSKPEADIKSLTISEVAKAVTDKTIEKIEVSGGNVNVSFKDGTKGKAKKEVESSLSETLFNYGVTKEDLSLAPIEIKNETGFGYWLLNILPFLLPVVIVIFFIWMLTRQVKGAGMQAFTFGQSKARITDPNDKNNKVTFKDVAGAKEAKEELKEIVDFLRNPKSFRYWSSYTQRSYLNGGSRDRENFTSSRRGRGSSCSIFPFVRIRICRDVCRSWSFTGQRFI